MKFITIGKNDLRINLDQVVRYKKDYTARTDGKTVYEIVFFGQEIEACAFFATEEARDKALEALDRFVNLARIG